MQERDFIEVERAYRDRSQDSSARSAAAFIPRFWMILIPAAVPIFVAAADFFEALESTGRIWGYLAAPMLSATTIAYAALIYFLKKKNI